jgi:hypothetical protein
MIARVRLLAVVSAVGVMTAGCFDAPKLEDRWTRIDIQSSNLAQAQMLTTGATQPITTTAAITYRKIITGYAVAELRVSTSVPPGGVEVSPNSPRLVMAQDIDTILQNSVTAGRATRAVTGWDHLIQTITFSFNGVVPATVDSMGVPLGAPNGVFMLVYLGSGVKLERPNLPDSIIVTPFNSGQYEILPIGMQLGVAP